MKSRCLEQISISKQKRVHAKYKTNRDYILYFITHCVLPKQKGCGIKELSTFYATAFA
jgi:hypothetical protein